MAVAAEAAGATSESSRPSVEETTMWKKFWGRELCDINIFFESGPWRCEASNASTRNVTARHVGHQE